MERNTDSTIDQRNIVIGMLTFRMMNKQIARHFEACDCTIPSIGTKIRQMGGVKNRHYGESPRKTNRREAIDYVTSLRRNRFLSSARMSGS